MGNYAEINSGVYVLSPGVFSVMDKIVTSNYKDSSGSESPDRIFLEGDIFPALASSGQLYVHRTNNFWSQIKTAGSAIYASRHYLESYRTSSDHASMLATGTTLLATCGSTQMQTCIHLHGLGLTFPSAWGQRLGQAPGLGIPSCWKGSQSGSIRWCSMLLSINAAVSVGGHGSKVQPLALTRTTQQHTSPRSRCSAATAG